MKPALLMRGRGLVIEILRQLPRCDFDGIELGRAEGRLLPRGTLPCQSQINGAELKGVLPDRRT